MEDQRFGLPFRPTSDQIAQKAFEVARKKSGSQFTEREAILLERQMRRKFGKNLPGKGLQGLRRAMRGGG